MEAPIKNRPHSPRCLLAVLVYVAACGSADGTVSIRVTDATTGASTPARLEIHDASGKSFVAPDAIRVTKECAFPPLPEWASAVQALRESRGVQNPYTGTRQFYLGEPATMELPPGSYRLRAYKGIEYRTGARAFEVRPGQRTHVTVALSRWSDFPSRGWYAADDHIHLSRQNETDDRRISRWMQAEDLDVANLLQMGTSTQFGVTAQYGFGDASVYAENGSLLLAGQEHPRTHIFGHTIFLGGDAAVDPRDAYADYRHSFAEAVRANGVAGFAHWGLGPARDGIAIEAPSGNVSFLEVLQFEYPHYDVWYELLNAGLRLAPTAGTDFPCGPSSLPGRERFYTKVEGTLDRDSWLDGVRRGRTFVTNGPLLEFEISAVAEGAERVEEARPAANRAEIGEVLPLDGPSRVRMAGAVHFDPTRDDVRTLELVRNGLPILTVSERVAPGVIGFELTREESESAWYALRASGDKVGESPFEALDVPDLVVRIGKNIASGANLDRREEFAHLRAVRPSAAHTAPITVRLATDRGVGDPAVAQLWLDRLSDIEAKFSDDRIGDLPIWSVPYGDGVDEDGLRRDRPAILEALRDARTYYESVGAPTPDPAPNSDPTPPDPGSPDIP